MIFSKELTWEFNKDKKIGHMRCQLKSNGLEANQWISEQKLTHDINAVAHEIIQVVGNYDNLVDSFCNGKEGFENETKYFYQKNGINYWIRTLPIGEFEYNLYINVYHQ